jgi:hypothetical protein
MRDDETAESARRVGLARHRAVSPATTAARWVRGGGSGTRADHPRFLAAGARDFGAIHTRLEAAGHRPPTPEEVRASVE